VRARSTCDLRLFSENCPSMTEQEACRLALDFVRERGLPTSRINVSRRIRFQHPTEGAQDLWVFCLATTASADSAEYAREIIVDVRNDTGEITFFNSDIRARKTE
jgi:hypothetical protein